MKILQIAQIHWYNAEVQYACDLTEGLIKLGHEVHFLTRPDSLAMEKAADRGFRVYVEDGFNGKGLGMLKALPAIAKLKSHLVREKYDIVEIHRSESLPLIAYACNQVKVPIVRVRADMRPVKANSANRVVYTKLLSGIVASNETIRRGLEERIGDIRHLKTIHGGVDVEEFTPQGERAGLRESLGFDPDTFLVGVLGRLSPVKGHGDFLQSAKLALEKNPKLGFVILAKGLGDNPVLDDLNETIEGDSDLKAHVRIIGHCENLPAVLRDFNLGAITSTGSEANCRVGLEWMACGVPLVATSIGVLPDMVRVGETGFLTPPGDPRGLAERILSFAAAPERTSKMGSAARKMVEERFSLTHLARSHERFLKDILSA